MTLTEYYTYVPPLIAIIALAIKWKGMKQFIPVGLFASLYANAVCHIAMHLGYWKYHAFIANLAVDCILTPIAAMFWVRYAPRGALALIGWNLIWTSIIGVLEFHAVHYSNVLCYCRGYKWYILYLLWFISWFIWYGFHIWYNNGKENNVYEKP